jgi:hypothetical protein
MVGIAAQAGHPPTMALDLTVRAEGAVRSASSSARDARTRTADLDSVVRKRA